MRKPSHNMIIVETIIGVIATIVIIVSSLVIYYSKPNPEITLAFLTDEIWEPASSNPALDTKHIHPINT